MLIKEQDFKLDAIERLAQEMCLAARTAPKARGVDLIITAIVKGDSIEKIADRMLEIHKEQKTSDSFVRDAESIRKSSHIVLIGTKLMSLAIKGCNFCGYDYCTEKPDGALCAYNPGDLGIAVGSAISIAADHRLDNRVMFSVGRVAIDMGLLGKDVKIAYGIPLSASGKSPFFDRK